MSTSRKVYYGTHVGLKVKIQVSINIKPFNVLQTRYYEEDIELNFNEED